MSAILSPAPPAIPTPGKVSPALTPIEPKKHSLWKIILPLGVVVGGAVLAYQFWPRPQPAAKAAASGGVRTTKVAMGTLIRAVRVGGQTSARNFALLTVPVFRGGENRGNLNLLKLIKPGSMVKKGDLMAQIDAQAALDRLDDANDTVEQAAADIRKRQAEQEVDRGNLQQDLRVAKSDWDKAKMDDQAAEVKTEIEREFLHLNTEEYGARLKQMEGDVPTSLASDRSELKMLEINRDLLTIRRNRQAVDIKKFTIVAPMAGLVVMQQVFRSGEMGQVQEGDQVSAGQALMKIVDPFSMQVEAVVNQSDSSEFRIGQKAVVGLDAFPELRFKGHVYSIGALAIRSGRENFYVRNVPVGVAVEGSDARFIPDLSAWADVEVERHENVLLVPREAVQSEGGETVVYVKRASGFEKRTVQAGSHDATHAVVLAGLQAGEEVALERPK
jgi:multidrug efflux pump subunit AcrA (membrane-fusion protein)